EEKRPRWGGRTSNPVGAVDGPLWVRLPLSSAIHFRPGRQAPGPSIQTKDSSPMAHEAGGDNRYTRGLAACVSGLRYEQIPAEVLARIKLLILDSLGCAIYGSELPWSRILVDTLRRLDNGAGASVWGTPYRLSAPHAALVNGTLV